MAATSQQIVAPREQTIKIAQPTGQPSIQQSHNSPTKSLKNGSERRPSFSITLPPSCSRSSQLGSKSIVFDPNVDSTAGFEEALQQEGTAADRSLQSLEPPVRRRSVQFIPGEDDQLTNHENKTAYIPKTPYPTTGEEDKRLLSQFSRS